MADTNETIADIIAEMRALSNPISDGIIAIDGRTIADRLDAAHKRELARVDAVIDEAVHGYPPEDIYDKCERGDPAKVREALLQVIRSMELESGHMCTEKKRLGMHGQTQEDLCKGCRARNDECWTMTLKRECEAALAAPPRNCDVFSTKDTAREAFQKLRGHRVWAEVSLWDDRDEIEAFLDWLFALWKEGGAK